MSRTRGQATIEALAALPLLALLLLAVGQAVAVGWTLVAAHDAARAGGRAEAIGGAAEPAAGAVLPAVLRRRLAVHVADGVVRVRVAVPSLVPGLHLHVQAEERS